MSVYKCTSPEILYSDVAKCTSKNSICSEFGSKVTTVNETLSKIVNNNDKGNVHVHGKVSSKKSRFDGVGTSMKCAKCSLKTSSETKLCNACNSVNQSNKFVNINDQDCCNITNTNHFAVLYVDSSKDEGDSLDSVTVKDSVTSCNGKEFQSGQTVEIHEKIGKTFSDFGKESLVEGSEHLPLNQNKEKGQNTKVPNVDCYRNTHITTGMSNKTLASCAKNLVTETGMDHSSAGDKYCLELQMKMKGEKYV